MMMTEGGETKHNTNINFLLEELGVMVNSGMHYYMIKVLRIGGMHYCYSEVMGGAWE